MDSPQSIAAGHEKLSLSLSQHEVWLDQRAWPDSTHLNIGGGAFLKGRLNLPLFRQALAHLVAENEALRLAPCADGSQLLLAQVVPVLEIVDLSKLPDPMEAIRVWWQRRIREPFALNGLPPWRFALLHAGEDLHGLTIQFHHLVMDGWGTSRVMQRWSEIYNALQASNELLPLGEPGYRQFIEESNSYRQSSAFARDADYWRAQISALPAPLIARQYATAGAAQLPPSRLSVQRISRADYAHLEQCANGLGATPFNFFLAALVLYFARVNHCQDVVIGIPSLNRGGRRFKSTLGMFVGVLALQVRIEPGMTARELLGAAASALRGALRHPRYPLSELGRSLQLIRSGRDGLFDVLLSFERQDYDVSFGDARLLDSRQLFSGTARYPLGVTVCEFHPQQDLELVLDASSACFAAGEAELLGRRLWHLVESFMARPDERIENVGILPPEEQWALIEGLHKDIACHAVTQPYIALFEHQVALRPEAIALVWDGGSLDYAALDRRATRLAGRLAALGVAHGAIVALAIARSPDMVLALLAIAKAGAAFLPLDMDAPVARLAEILKESDAAALLVQAPGDERLTQLHHRAVLIDWNDSSPDSMLACEIAMRERPAPQDLAYVLFTSGSTGRPKGVTVDYATLSRRLAWLSRAFAVNWRDRSAQATQLTFDPSLIEIILPLIHGASVALPPPGRLLPEPLAEFVLRHGVTFMAFVPSTLARFLDAAGRRPELRLRVACCGGEVLPPDLASRFIVETGAHLYNVYGPTETAIFATAWKCSVNSGDQALPIGRPIDDTRIYVLDTGLRPLPLGMAGEIFIGGDAIAKGYLHRAELNREVFLDDPFRPGSRMYRTGDRGWLGVDGNLHFIGRLDRQIKLRGYRIELGEIEAACIAVEGVSQAAAKLVTRRDKALIHVWVAAPGAVNTDNLQRILRARLPDYMIPGGISVVPVMPESSAGKIDYAALPEPELTVRTTVTRTATTALERDLLALWESVLEPRPIGMEDNFFDLGGDSLAAVSILAGVEKNLGRKVPMYLLTENPTIERLAGALGKVATYSPGLMIPLGKQVGGHGRVPLYLAASGHGDLLRFQNLARALGNTCDAEMLQPPMDRVVKTVAELAELYANCIQAQGREPGFLAGFSVGGIAALETARLLRQRGIGVRGLVLIDTIYPKAVFGGTRSWRMLGWLVRNLHVQELSMNGRRLGAMFNDPGLVGQVMALSDYRPVGFDAPTLLIKSSGLASWDRWFFRPWQRLIADQLAQRQVAGLHGSIFETGNVGELAAVMTEALGLPHVDGA